MDLTSNSDLIPNQKPVDKSHCKSLHLKNTYSLSFFKSNLCCGKLNDVFTVGTTCDMTWFCLSDICKSHWQVRIYH